MTIANIKSGSALPLGTWAELPDIREAANALGEGLFSIKVKEAVMASDVTLTNLISDLPELALVFSVGRPCYALIEGSIALELLATGAKNFVTGVLTVNTSNVSQGYSQAAIVGEKNSLRVSHLIEAAPRVRYSVDLDCVVDPADASLQFKALGNSNSPSSRESFLRVTVLPRVVTQ